jgi:hypothetical protein
VIALSAVWHMIEWNRAAIHLFSALVEVNMLPLYYGLSVNVLVGLIVCVWAIIVRFSPDGVACAAAQESRGTYLALHVLFLFLYVFTSFHHVLLFKIMGIDWLDEVINEEDEEDDD